MTNIKKALEMKAMSGAGAASKDDQIKALNMRVGILEGQVADLMDLVAPLSAPTFVGVDMAAGSISESDTAPETTEAPVEETEAEEGKASE